MAKIQILSLNEEQAQVEESKFDEWLDEDDDVWKPGRVNYKHEQVKKLKPYNNKTLHIYYIYEHSSGSHTLLRNKRGG